MKESLEQRIEALQQAFESRHIKITHQRMEIFKEIVSTDDHPDAEVLYMRVRNRLPYLSLDTVYRTLWLFKDLGLITTLSLTRDRSRFDANLDRHHHFICSVCGLTKDFYAEQFDELELPDTLREIGQPGSIHVEVHGICRDCADKYQNTD
ncbi:MAG: transcriptional repressor [Sphaerochaetaceae bacterium]|nr:transcriptional repressor [Sphaerochaetaceae bacterium]